MSDDVFKEIKRRTRILLKGKDLLDQKVWVKARPLSTEEAIGNPEADDFPLQKGNEKLMQADFNHALGQAFTDQYGDFEGTLEEILRMPLENNYRRAVFVATLNAVLRYIGVADKTIHCRDQEPAQCAKVLRSYIHDRYGIKRVVQIGFQPRMAEYLAPHFPFRLIDMDPDNIGTRRFGVDIEAPEATDDAVRWADILLVTGTTLVNATIQKFLGGKPVIFYGTTIAGAACLMGWDRFCEKSK